MPSMKARRLSLPRRNDDPRGDGARRARLRLGGGYCRSSRERLAAPAFRARLYRRHRGHGAALKRCDRCGAHSRGTCRCAPGTGRAQAIPAGLCVDRQRGQFRLSNLEPCQPRGLRPADSAAGPVAAYLSASLVGADRADLLCLRWHAREELRGHIEGEPEPAPHDGRQNRAGRLAAGRGCTDRFLGIRAAARRPYLRRGNPGAARGCITQSQNRSQRRARSLMVRPATGRRTLCDC